MILCLRYWYQPYNGGCEWSGWPCYLSFGRAIGRTDVDYSKYAHYEALARVGPRMMYSTFAVVAPRPLARRTQVDERGEHNLVSDDPIQYSDGVVDAPESRRVREPDGPVEPTVIYRLVGSEYVRQALDGDDVAAARWARACEAAENDEELARCEQNMLAAAGA